MGQIPPLAEATVPVRFSTVTDHRANGGFSPSPSPVSDKWL